jgi:hypothetical protein
MILIVDNRFAAPLLAMMQLSCPAREAGADKQNRSRGALMRLSFAHHHDAIPKKIRPRQHA